MSLQKDIWVNIFLTNRFLSLSSLEIYSYRESDWSMYYLNIALFGIIVDAADSVIVLCLNAPALQRESSLRMVKGIPLDSLWHCSPRASLETSPNLRQRSQDI